MKKSVASLCILGTIILSACSGVSQAEYDAVLSENQALKEQLAQYEYEAEDEQPASESVNLDYNAGETLIYDSDGLLVEYTGLTEYSDHSLLIGVRIENTTGKELSIDFQKCLINQSNIGLGNSIAIVPSDSNYLVGPNFNFVITIDDLRQYEISTITSLSFDFVSYADEDYSSPYLSFPVTIEENYPL